MIQELTASPEPGKTYLGTVTRIVDFLRQAAALTAEG